MTVLRAFALKVESHMTDKTFARLPCAFPESQVPSIDIAKSRVQFLSGVKPVRYHCCVNSCCCFVGPHAHRDNCPYCREPRYYPGSNKEPRKTFAYLPVIPRLIGMCANADKMEEMGYRANEHVHIPGRTTDVFDSTHFRSLLGKRVVINGHEAPYTYFSDSRDIALGLATDGFGPFKHRKSTAWPLILFNYNLGPENRIHIDNIIPVGIVPGPKKPVDMDSFLWPLIEELNQLQLGIRAYDGLKRELFLLRAFLIHAFGDIPAISMLMCMKGHNGFSPCRMCKITGVSVPGSRGTTLYVPLDRSRHPGILDSPSNIRAYDPSALPLRSEEEMLRQGEEVMLAPTKGRSDNLSRTYGIKGVPLLAELKSLSFPHSFPYDFMHLMWENCVDNLILLWTGNFKGLDEGDEDYQLDSKVWDAIGAATAASGSTIPSAFGARSPNFTKQKSACSAETWSFWTLFLGPVLLRRRFRKRKYYNHFVELVKLIHICLQFEISDDEIDFLRAGFIKWVKDYEE
jgi:Transposase family tnp2